MSLRAKRGTRAQINAAASGGLLKTGELIYISDEGKVAYATSTTAYNAIASGDPIQMGDLVYSYDTTLAGYVQTGATGVKNRADYPTVSALLKSYPDYSYPFDFNDNATIPAQVNTYAQQDYYQSNAATVTAFTPMGMVSTKYEKYTFPDDKALSTRYSLSELYEGVSYVYGTNGKVIAINEFDDSYNKVIDLGFGTTTINDIYAYYYGYNGEYSSIVAVGAGGKIKIFFSFVTTKGNFPGGSLNSFLYYKDATQNYLGYDPWSATTTVAAWGTTNINKVTAYFLDEFTWIIVGDSGKIGILAVDETTAEPPAISSTNFETYTYTFDVVNQGVVPGFTKINDVAVFSTDGNVYIVICGDGGKLAYKTIDPSTEEIVTVNLSTGWTSIAHDFGSSNINVIDASRISDPYASVNGRTPIFVAGDGGKMQVFDYTFAFKSALTTLGGGTFNITSRQNIANTIPLRMIPVFGTSSNKIIITDLTTTLYDTNPLYTNEYTASQFIVKTMPFTTSKTVVAAFFDATGYSAATAGLNGTTLNYAGLYNYGYNPITQMFLPLPQDNLDFDDFDSFNSFVKIS